MYFQKFFVITIFISIFQPLFSQTKFYDIINIKWESKKSDIKSLFPGKNMSENTVLQYNGLAFKDTVDNIPLKIALLFNTDGNLVLKGFSNLDTDADKTFTQLKNKCIETIGTYYKEKDMGVIKTLIWDLKNGEQAVLTFMKLNSNVQLTITKNKMF